jgi:hypothetical protein
MALTLIQFLAIMLTARALVPSGAHLFKSSDQQLDRCACGQGVRNAGRVTVLGMIREIDIWAVAVLMVKRYAEDAEANADRRADELETEGDQAGAAIWHRVTFAIEKLTDTTGPLH